MKVPGVKSRNSKCLDLQRRGKRFFGRMGWDADSDNNWLQSLPETEGSTLVQVEPHRGSFRFREMITVWNNIANVKACMVREDRISCVFINCTVKDRWGFQAAVALPSGQGDVSMSFPASILVLQGKELSRYLGRSVVVRIICVWVARQIVTLTNTLFLNVPIF